MIKLSKSFNILYQALNNPKTYLRLIKKSHNLLKYNIYAITIRFTENFTVNSSVFSAQDLVVMQLNPFHKNKEIMFFSIKSFSMTNSLNIDISSKTRLCSAVEL